MHQPTWRQTLIAATAAFFVVGCFGKSKKAEEPVRSEPVSSERQAPASEFAAQPRPAPASGPINPRAVFDWQAFFKPAPTASQRTLLEQKLATWPSGGSESDALAKGRSQLVLGQLAAAEASFRTALRLNSESREAKLELAALYLKQHKLNHSFAFLARCRDHIATEDDITSSYIMRYKYVLALAHIARNEHETGHNLLSDLVGEQKDFTPAYVALASSYISLGRIDVADYVARRGLDRAKPSASLFNVLGVVDLRQGDKVAATTWFDKALEQEADYPPALVNRARVSLENLEYTAAEADLVRSLTRDPNSVAALVTLGIVQKRQGKISAAEASFAKAIDVDPENALARFNMGVLLATDRKRPNAALRLFHEVVQTQNADDRLKRLSASYINDLRDQQAAY